MNIGSVSFEIRNPIQTLKVRVENGEEKKTCSVEGGRWRVEGGEKEQCDSLQPHPTTGPLLTVSLQSAAGLQSRHTTPTRPGNAVITCVSRNSPHPLNIT